MNPLPEERIPVIVAFGETVDRPEHFTQGKEPVSLIAETFLAADTELGGQLLQAVESIDLVGLTSWRYKDPVARLCELLQIAPARQINASMGGDTPLRLIHDACLRIQDGEHSVCAVVGGEAENTRTKARRSKQTLDWTPMPSREEAAKIEFSRLPLNKCAKIAGITNASQIYPFYELALQAKEGLSPKEGTAQSAALCAQFAQVAAHNPSAWIKEPPTVSDIATVTDNNRMIAFPYSKLMVANPSVNQAATVVVASLAWARQAGIDESKLVYVWGGAAAQEPEDFLLRDRYDRSAAQEAVMDQAVAIAGGSASAFDLVELYSCFPVVPKLCQKYLELREEVKPSVAGGLTYFGGPFNNYMSHATCAMVRAIREDEGALGLLYGNGGLVSKHHCLVVSSDPSPGRLEQNYKLDANMGPVPELLENYVGEATVETYTAIYDNAGALSSGVVIARTPSGSRVIAKVRKDDEVSLALLTSTEVNAIGQDGYVRCDVFGYMVWEAGGERDRSLVPRHFCTVERDGPVTLVTINRPEAMNALTPQANEELAEVFDAFASDPDQWVAILTGAGDRAFSSGNDLKYTAKAMARGERMDIPLTGFGGLTSREGLIKPVIAAVNGVAMGGGFEIALACDLIIASDTAKFALPEPKVGLAALAGGLHRLPRQIGLKHAMGLILTGRSVSASEGGQLGFVNEVTAPGELLTVARRWAAQIIACSPMSIRTSKAIVTQGLSTSSVYDAISEQAKGAEVKALFRSQDFREGPRAFAEKRTPSWSGR